MTGNSRNKNNNGFSLMEIVVSLGVFGFIISISLGIFVNVVKSQQLTLAAQTVQESLRYSLEMMSKELRSAKNNFNGNDCVNAGVNELKVYEIGDDRTETHLTGNNYKVTGTSIVFRDKDDVCTKYRISAGRLEIGKDDSGNNAFEADEFLPITPNDLTVNSLSFAVRGTKNGEVKNIQDTVTLNIEIQSNGPINYKTRIQTTISSRRY